MTKLEELKEICDKAIDILKITDEWKLLNDSIKKRDDHSIDEHNAYKKLWDAYGATDEYKSYAEARSDYANERRKNRDIK